MGEPLPVMNSKYQEAASENAGKRPRGAALMTARRAGGPLIITPDPLCLQWGRRSFLKVSKTIEMGNTR